MLQTHVNNDIYNKYCPIHNTSPLQGKERFMKQSFLPQQTNLKSTY